MEPRRAVLAYEVQSSQQIQEHEVQAQGLFGEGGEESLETGGDLAQAAGEGERPG